MSLLCSSVPVLWCSLSLARTFRDGLYRFCVVLSQICGVFVCPVLHRVCSLLFLSVICCYVDVLLFCVGYVSVPSCFLSVPSWSDLFGPVMVFCVCSASALLSCVVLCRFWMGVSRILDMCCMIRVVPWLYCCCVSVCVCTLMSCAYGLCCYVPVLLSCLGLSVCRDALCCSAGRCCYLYVLCVLRVIPVVLFCSALLYIRPFVLSFLCLFYVYVLCSRSSVLVGVVPRRLCGVCSMLFCVLMRVFSVMYYSSCSVMSCLLRCVLCALLFCGVL